MPGGPTPVVLASALCLFSATGGLGAGDLGSAAWWLGWLVVVLGSGWFNSRCEVVAEMVEVVVLRDLTPPVMVVGLIEQLRNFGF